MAVAASSSAPRGGVVAIASRLGPLPGAAQPRVQEVNTPSFEALVQKYSMNA